MCWTRAGRWIAVLAAVGCGDGVRPLSIDVIFDEPRDEEHVASIRVEIFRVGCDSEDRIYDVSVPRNESVGMQPPLLAPGTYYVRARALEIDCMRTHESDCLVVSVPPTRPNVDVRLRAIRTPVFGCDLARCIDGSCVPDPTCLEDEMHCLGSADDDCDPTTPDYVESIDNCGSCGVRCTAGDRPAACVAGACTCETPGPGVLYCPVLGGCVSLGASEHCGVDCETTARCEDPTPSCRDEDGVGGPECVGPCPAPRIECPLATGAVCVEDPLTDPQFCGTACVDCGEAVVGAEGSCVDGLCTYESCAPGLVDCDASRANGCNDFMTDEMNCGTCGNVCVVPDHAMGIECLNGRCVPDCIAPYRNCSGTSRCTIPCPSDGGV